MVLFRGCFFPCVFEEISSFRLKALFQNNILDQSYLFLNLYPIGSMGRMVYLPTNLPSKSAIRILRGGVWRGMAGEGYLRHLKSQKKQACLG